MTVTPRYPVYVIHQDVGTGFYPVVSHVPERSESCLLVYQTKELAELYIEQVKNLHSRHGDKYDPREMNKDQFQSLLRANDDVTLAAWNCTTSPSTFVFLPTDQLLAG